MIQEQADAVVIGGGIVGCATAYYLAKRKAKVVLLEKGNIADEQSSRALGFVRQQGRDPREMPMAVAANKMWRTLSQELNADIEWVQAGNLRLANDEGTFQRFHQWLPISREFGVDTQVLSPGEVKELIPAMEGSWTGGMYTASDGHAEPMKATTAFARAAQQRGAKVYTWCAANGIEVTNHQVTAVITERGVIKTPVVVCAAGAWSSKVAGLVGLSLPQRVVVLTETETLPVPPVTDIGVWGGGVSIRQRPNGSLVLGGGRAVFEVTLASFRHLRMFLPIYRANWRLFMLHIGTELFKELGRSLPGSPARRHPFAHTVGVEPKPDRKAASRARENFARTFPSLATVEFQRVWAGRIDGTPDAIPVLGEVDRPNGFLFATGMSGHGFAFGPIAGLLLSELILDGKPSIDIHDMRYSRFREGAITPPSNFL